MISTQDGPDAELRVVRTKSQLGLRITSSRINVLIVTVPSAAIEGSPAASVKNLTDSALF